MAQAAALRHATDMVDRWLVFGPRAVAIHRLRNAVQRHDLAAAARLAAQVPPARGSRLPATWEAWFQLQLAAVHLDAGHDASAIACLLEARREAYEWTRRHPTTVSVVRRLLESPRRPSQTLADLATYVRLLGPAMT